MLRIPPQRKLNRGSGSFLPIPRRKTNTTSIRSPKTPRNIPLFILCLIDPLPPAFASCDPNPESRKLYPKNQTTLAGRCCQNFRHSFTYMNFPPLDDGGECVTASALEPDILLRLFAEKSPEEKWRNPCGHDAGSDAWHLRNRRCQSYPPAGKGNTYS